MTLDCSFLAELLTQELTCAQNMMALLEQEKTALANDDLQALQALQQQSLNELQSLQDQASKRLAWFEQHQFPHSPEFLTHPDVVNAPEIVALWQALEAQYLQNRTMSEKLSDLVLTARYRTQQKLKILRGHENTANLYDEKGQAGNTKPGAGYIKA